MGIPKFFPPFSCPRSECASVNPAVSNVDGELSETSAGAVTGDDAGREGKGHKGSGWPPRRSAREAFFRCYTSVSRDSTPRTKVKLNPIQKNSEVLCKNGCVVVNRGEKPLCANLDDGRDEVEQLTQLIKMGIVCGVSKGYGTAEGKAARRVVVY